MDKYSQNLICDAIQEFISEYSYTPTRKEFCTYANVSSSTLSRYGGWSSLRDRAIEAVSHREAQAVLEHEIHRRAREHRGEMRAIIQDLERRNKELQSVTDHLLNVEEILKDFHPKKIDVKNTSRSLPEATYIMLASDWHVGERVRPEQVGFRNEYNPDIAQERGRRFWQSNYKMLNAARASWTIDNVVLWLGGDLITGYIHEEFEADNFLSPTEETLLAYQMVTEGIDCILDSYDVENLTVVTSNGNHGRTGRKKRIADDFRNSYEFMLYHLLAKHYKDNNRVTFQISPGYYNYLNVYDMQIRFSHGDGIRSSGGVGGLAPPLYRRLGRLPAADIDCMGHFHQLDFLRKFCRNGSLIGWNPFADFTGCEFEPPQQASFVVDSKHKICCNFNPILVT